MSTTTPGALPADLLGLLAGCKERPEEETPRLVLADWLEEHGGPEEQARAEHIRLEVECERLPRHDHRRIALQRHADELKRQHGPAWLGSLAQRVPTWWLQRGLVWVRVSAET